MHKSDKEMVEKTHNTARFFTEQRHISWVLLLAVIAWGFYGYMKMPKRKDPEVPVRIAVAMTSWPGASAEKVEVSAAIHLAFDELEFRDLALDRTIRPRLLDRSRNRHLVRADAGCKGRDQTR